jgi:hypothetical protein
MKASDYLAQCPFREYCDDVRCSPWGFTHAKSPEVNGKILLIVGLNANDKGLEEDCTRTEYSNYLKDSIRDEIRNKPKCLSNLMRPITHFLLQSESIESQLIVLEHLNWCNLISCCPSSSTLRARPTTQMRKYCEKRLKEDNNHELINRIASIRPTHILVVHSVARKLWTDSNQPGSKLYETLKQTQAPTISFSKHPSYAPQWMKLDAYQKEVYQALVTRSENKS